MIERELSDNEIEAIKRCEYASDLLTNKSIPHEVKKKEIGHINLLYQGKVVMSFWARTGKFIYTVKPVSNYSRQNDLDRGIRNCIKCYKEEFK